MQNAANAMLFHVTNKYSINCQLLYTRELAEKKKFVVDFDC